VLCDLLGVDRWQVFSQAITARPLCSSRYVLTGRGKIDGLLSRVVNRAWQF
jgi:hypothetical protein